MPEQRGSRGRGSGRAPIDWARLTREDPDNSVLSNAARTLSRGGYALRSLLALDPGGAAQNMVEGVSDVYTGGFLKQGLNPLRHGARALGISPAPETELTDVIAAWGGRPPEVGTWSRAGTNLAGGILLDPTTFVNPGGGTAGKTLSTLLRTSTGTFDDVARPLALAAARRGLTAKGVSELVAREIPVYRGLGLNRADDAADLASQLNRAHLDRLRAKGLPEVPLENALAKATKLQRTIQHRALDEMLGGKFGDTAVLPRLSGDVERAYGRLVSEGLAQAPHMRIGWWKIPGSVGPRETLSHLARWSLPGVLTRGARKWEPVAKALDSGQTFAQSLYSKYLVGTVPKSVQIGAEQIELEKAGRNQADLRWLETTGAPKVAGAGIEGRQAAGRTWLEVEDRWLAGEQAAIHATDPTPQALPPEDLSAAFLPGFEQPLPPRPARFGSQQSQAGARVTGGQELMARLGASGVDPALLAAWQTQARRIQKELVALGKWDEIRDTPFYLQRAVKQEVVEAFGKDSPDFALLTREYPRLADWTAKVDEAVKVRAAADPAFRMKLAAYGVDPEVPGSAVEWDVLRLMANRLGQHTETVARHKFRKIIETHKGTIDPGGQTPEQDALDAYMQNVWYPMGRGDEAERKGLSFILGGGRRKDGTYWPGVNRYLKTLRYTIWPSGWHRDFYGNALSMALDPEIAHLKLRNAGTGGGALNAYFRTLFDVPLLKFSQKHMAPDQTYDFLTAAAQRGTPEEVAAARAKVSGLRVGSYTGQEVLDAIDTVTGRSAGQVDIDLVPIRLEKLGLEVRGAPKGRIDQWFDKAQQLHTGITAELERGLRVQHLTALMERGHHPLEAARRVNKAFVDYNLQSKADRWFRDLTVFGRYPLAITPHVVEGLVAKPRIGVGLASAKDAFSGDEEVLPEHLRSGLALRVPGPSGNWISSFGTPQEAAAAAVEGVLSPSGFRRQWLSMLSDPLRLPAEAVTQRSFRFGDEWGRYRRAPAWLPDAATTRVETPYGTRREIPGWINEVIRAMPTSRLTDTADRILRATEDDAPESAGHLVTRLLTGARAQRVDEERALRQRTQERLDELVESGELGELTRYYPRGAKPSAAALEELDTLAALEASRKKRR